ncbi:hypothetical protein ACIKP9_02625 [Methylobacillus methanolivorans]|uniref:Uncharacterized protein n=1 Tax=Methylobacillus methanolivorans TaxID=1848927 RepID=A0ABW8GME9_9PROT
MMKNKFKKPKISRTADIYKLIYMVKNVEKRNQLRGYSSKHTITSIDAENIRRKNNPHDSIIVGALMKGPGGLLSEHIFDKKRQSNDLFTINAFPNLDWRGEVNYTVGYLNSMSKTVTDILDLMRPLAHLNSMSSDDALAHMLNISKKYGASNYLSYKLAYLRSSRDLNSNQVETVSKIEDEIGHRDNVGMHFSALENLSSKISLFVISQRRINGLIGKINGDFRKAITLSNFIPTPLDENDVAGFLLRATESSLMDTIYSIIVIFNLKDSLSGPYKELIQKLNEDIIQAIASIIEEPSEEVNDNYIVTEYYASQATDSYPSMDLYRTSSAFLEVKKYAKYRNKFDRVIGARLLEEIINGKIYTISESFNDKLLLTSSSITNVETEFPITLDTFYRTYLFLKFIGNRNNILELSDNDVKFIFENTIALDTLLTEEEMNKFLIITCSGNKNLVSVLALALFRKKSIDPDIDYEFRADFIEHVKHYHNGSILNFINYLLEDSPQVANYIVASLDEITLEKMYNLIKNASEASKIRGDILRAVGKKLNRLEFIIQADAITTRSKLSKLQQYFDSSRMYVDSVSMKKWLDSNPTISTEQYRSLITNYKTEITAHKDKNIIIIQLNDQEEYLIAQIAKDAFEQFCLNTEFGIQSYLGRRIRHNTLDGVTTDTVDAVLRKPEFSSFMGHLQMRRIVDSWMSSYKEIIDKLRRDHLQFKSSNSLFNAVIDMDDPTTKENIRGLTSTIRSAGGSELLNELIISFCWKQITPQLENAARFIKTTLLQEAYGSIDKYFSGNHGSTEEQIKSELHQAVNEVFKKVADWFQVPQTGYISASIKDLCQIILMEHNKVDLLDFSGNGVDVKYTGISVHRLYDCLAVLLTNAQKHGEENKKIKVDVNVEKPNQNSNLDLVSIDITSIVLEEEYVRSKSRIYDAIESRETGIDMVTEGYTGIKKIKFITRQYETNHTLRCKSDDSKFELKLGFSIHAETANEEAMIGVLE